MTNKKKHLLYQTWKNMKDRCYCKTNGNSLYNRDYHLDKDLKDGKIYSLENCVVLLQKENLEMAYRKQQKQIVAMNENEEIMFQSISEAGRNLSIPRNTIQYYLKNGKRHPIGYHFKYCC